MVFAVKLAIPYVAGLAMCILGVISLKISGDKDVALALITGGAGVMGGAGYVHAAQKDPGA